MDKIEVTQADREAATSLMSDVGLFSNVLTAKAVQAFARHRLATRTDATPVGVASPFAGSDGGFTTAVFNAVTVPVGTNLYTHPPATDVAALVEALQAIVNQSRLGDGSRPVTFSKRVNYPAGLLFAAQVALAPFTKGQP